LEAHPTAFQCNIKVYSSYHKKHQAAIFFNTSKAEILFSLGDDKIMVLAASKNSTKILHF
jgi:hypothetical protein